MTPETLRKWIRQDEVDAGQRAGKTSAEHAEIRQLKRDRAELERTLEVLSAASAFLLGSWTRNVVDLFVHHRPQGPARGPVDLSSAVRAWHQDRPEYLLRAAEASALQASLVGLGVDRGPGWVLRTAARRCGQPETGPGVVVWDHEMLAHLNRQGITVAKCTVGRLKRENGWEGVVRTKRMRHHRSRPRSGQGR